MEVLKTDRSYVIEKFPCGNGPRRGVPIELSDLSMMFLQSGGPVVTRCLYAGTVFLTSQNGGLTLSGFCKNCSTVFTAEPLQKRGNESFLESKMPPNTD